MLFFHFNNYQIHISNNEYFFINHTINVLINSYLIKIFSSKILNNFKINHKINYTRQNN